MSRVNLVQDNSPSLTAKRVSRRPRRAIKSTLCSTNAAARCAFTERSPAASRPATGTLSAVKRASCPANSCPVAVEAPRRRRAQLRRRRRGGHSGLRTSWMRRTSASSASRRVGFARAKSLRRRPRRWTSSHSSSAKACARRYPACGPYLNSTSLSSRSATPSASDSCGDSAGAMATPSVCFCLSYFIYST